MILNLIILIITKITISLSICNSGKNYCSKCNPITKLCVKCEKDIYTPNNYGGCDIIKKCKLGDNYCLECQENEILCRKCEIGYYPDEYGGCSYSQNCELSFQGKCLICKKNYALVGIENSDEGKIMCKSLNSDDLSNCEKIDSLNGICEKCKEGYYLNIIDKKCTKIENCSKSSFGICKQCNNGYYLDKQENKCKKISENEIFENCKETHNGQFCDICNDDYYLDENGKCIGINFCAKKGNYGECEKCIEDYYISEIDTICTTTDNCYYGNKHSGICEICKKNYYLDLKEGKCISNQEENNFKYCRIVDNDNNCIQCDSNYNLGNDKRCSFTKNCEKAEKGKCIQCKQNYYLGLDNICTNIEHCIYSEDYICIECEDNYYYDQNLQKCLIAEGNFTNCKYSVLDANYCERCKNDFYINETNHLCYSNKENEKFYKCAVNYANSDICDICIKGYHLGYIDKKCSKIEGCDISENENKCIECDENYCLNLKTGECEDNNRIISEDEKYYYKCNKTNEEGNSCDICLDGFELNVNGLCTDNIHCSEQKEGNCIKCQDGYCLNNIFGCVEMFFDNCLECNDIFNMDRCTKCQEGYRVDEFDTCTEI